MHRRRAIVGSLIALLLAALPMVGCGYKMGVVIDEEKQVGLNVAVIPFRNGVNIRQREPGIEIRLDQAIRIVALQQQYRLYDTEDADLVISGELLSLDQETLSQTAAGEESEVRVALQVRVTYTPNPRLHPGRDSWDRFIRVADIYALTGGETNDEAEDRVFDAIAREVFASANIVPDPT